jgi:hypothetical protein
MSHRDVQNGTGNANGIKLKYSKSAHHRGLLNSRTGDTLRCMARPTIFKCPETGMNVQHWLADVPEDKKDHHSLVVCLACTKTHLIHNSTGEALGTQVE